MISTLPSNIFEDLYGDSGYSNKSDRKSITPDRKLPSRETRSQRSEMSDFCSLFSGSLVLCHLLKHFSCLFVLIG